MPAEKRYCRVDGGLLCCVRFLNKFVCSICGLVYEIPEGSTVKPGVGNPKESLASLLAEIEKNLKQVSREAHFSYIKDVPLGGASSDSDSNAE